MPSLSLRMALWAAATQLLENLPLSRFATSPVIKVSRYKDQPRLNAAYKGSGHHKSQCAKVSKKLSLLMLSFLKKICHLLSWPLVMTSGILWLPCDTCYSPMLIARDGFSLPAVKCDDVAEPQNGVMDCAHASTGEFTYKSACAFQCKEGFRLRGSAQLECTSQGKWTQEVPSCQGNTEFRLSRHTST